MSKVPLAVSVCGPSEGGKTSFIRRVEKDTFGGPKEVIQDYVCLKPD